MLRPRRHQQHNLLRNISFAVVDFETTGVDPATDRIVQAAAVVVNGAGEVVESFETVVKPESPDEYVHGAEHVHGISAEQVARGMPLRQALEKIWDISDGKLFAAHNAKFDINFLHAESQRVGLDKTVSDHVDTLALSRLADAERSRRHSLAALCEHYGIERDRAHDALADASATAELLVRLLHELGVENPDQLSELME